ncbi:hypothetical protein EGW08_016376 [Elysia chlorotica]|uniref:Ammonium transporter AmtB-like domain-containing protein n=1 Tax=Elysia chlorotica TaxID=188477 RepID=A0A433T2T6_ELYCH|nr:hypothetical protein EGW08_016376 [Elysia chlorotica]
MAKNVADVVFGGISYWMLGYGLSFGDGEGTNGFCGVGKFFIDPDESVMGEEFARFVFQSSFATTATTIVSGAVAERTRFIAYIIFSFFNTFVFCFPAHWVWASSGWLHKMGVVDVAGDGPVHLVGGVTSLVAAIMIKPRHKRFTPEDDHDMGSPTGALLGLFTLWWGWLAFNCGSTYGISGGKWKMAASMFSSVFVILKQSATYVCVYPCFHSFIFNKRKFYIPWIINSVLGGLVSITATCAVTGIWESLVIGSVGAVFVLLSDAALRRLHIDDPVGAVSVHGVAGVWGLLAAGVFTHKDNITEYFSDRHGIVKEEIIGSDIVEHNIQRIDLVQFKTLHFGDEKDKTDLFKSRYGALSITPSTHSVHSAHSAHSAHSVHSVHSVHSAHSAHSAHYAHYAHSARSSRSVHNMQPGCIADWSQD